MRLLANAYNKSQSSAKVTVTGGGSGAGITGAANGSLDIGNSSRDPRSSDPKTLVFTKVAREPFVIVVNPGNPTTNLTLDQIKAILTGKVRSWSDVGWKQGGPIKVYGRVSTSGTFATCKALFTGGAEYRSDAPALASNARDLAIVIVTHNLARARRVADRVGFFLDGELVELQAAKTLFESPSDQRTADYVAGRFG